MEKNEIKEFSKVSWAVFLFTITVVLISLVSVVFPALFTETFFQNELDGYGISEHFSLNPFEIGGKALPLVETNIINFGMFSIDSISSNMFITASFAPPCAGPHNDAIPEAMHANGFAPEDPAKRTVEVDAFCS